MSATRCDFSDLLASDCGCRHCRPDLSVRTTLAVDYTFTAQYDGKCDVCTGPFWEGETVGRIDGAGYACPSCLR